jgi:multidrug efflux pump subunit AcrB
MITWFAKNSVAANLLMSTIIALGFYHLVNKMPLEVFPSIDADRISISVSLRGATPEDVEQGVTIRIEQAIEDLEGIEKITSESSEGASRVSVEVITGYDARELLADIKSRVDAINTFPTEAEKPVVSLAQRTRDVITVTVAGLYSEKEIKEFAQAVYDDLLRLPQISQLTLSGVRNDEIAIELSQDKLQQYQLTLKQVATKIGNYSTDISAGNIKTSGGDILIRSKGQAYYKGDFANIVIKQQTDGSIIRLADIATIRDDFEETPIRTRFNGKPAAFINVYRIGNESAIEVADAVKNYIEDKQATLPKGFELSYWDDDSDIVKKRIQTLTSNAIQGGILVLALLTLFLRPAIAFWVFIGIPVSFMGAFIVMPYFGITLNIMSLFGFILVLGIVVDDAIVTGENVYTHLRHAESGEQAAIQGTLEVATPVTFGVLTTVAAFLPLAFIDGVRGALFAQIPIVVIPVLLFSLIESKFVLPSHLKHLKLRHQKTKQSRFEQFQQRFADGFERAILRYYQPLLKRAVDNKTITVSLFLSVFIIIFALIFSGWTRFVFFPRIPSETVRANLTMPAGTPFEVTNQYILLMSDAAEKLKQKYTNEATGESLVLNILATTGGRGGSSNTGGVRFEIEPPEKRYIDVDSRQLLAEWRKMIGVIPGAESLTYRAEIGRSSDPIDIQLQGSSLATLKLLAADIKQRLATYPTVFDISDSLSDGKEELYVELNRQGLSLGLTRVDVAQQVRSAYYGSQVQRVQRGREDVRVMVRLPLDERRSLADLYRLNIQTPQGDKVPLAHIATLTTGQSPSTINRVDGYRTVNIIADYDKTQTNVTALQADLRSYIQQLLKKYPDVQFEFEGEAKEQRQSFGSLQWGLGFVLFVIYALLAIPFKSYSQPLIVMSVIPFGVLGAVVGHWIMAMDLTIMSVLGMLALIGVLVNDSLVLVDYINQRINKGDRLYDAVLTAGTARFRPVILTSLTTFIGLMPLLFEQSTQAQFLIPMAVSLGFGILFATFITLLLVPVNYLLLTKVQAWLFPNSAVAKLL